MALGEKLSNFSTSIKLKKRQSKKDKTQKPNQIKKPKQKNKRQIH